MTAASVSLILMRNSTRSDSIARQSGNTATQNNTGKCSHQGAFAVLCYSDSDTGEFFIGRHVDDLELFGVQRRVLAELQFSEVALFDLDHVLFVLGAEALQNGRMDDDQQLEV